MSLPYRWSPEGTTYTREPAPGMLWPFEHEVYRIVEVNPVPESDWTDAEREYVGGIKAEFRAAFSPRMIVVRPASVTSGDVRDRDHDRHFRYGGRFGSLDVYADDHYPICAQCHEPIPCRDKMVERISEQAIARMGRFEVPGICPACSEPVTRRQESQTWPDNAVVFQGPPVTFHLRSRCFSSAVDYEKRWVAADSEHRRSVLSCVGMVTNHNDGTYECSQLTECPGPRAQHKSYTVCRCVDCHARGSFDCRPSPNSRNAALDGAS